MLIKSSFNIDLVQLKHTYDKDGMVRSYRQQAAIELGYELTKVFPYDLTPFDGDVPEIALTRDHQFVDKYQMELHVFTREQMSEILNCVREGNIPELVKILTS